MTTSKHPGLLVERHTEPVQHLQKIWAAPEQHQHVAGRNTKEGTPVSIMHHVMQPRNGTPVVGALLICPHQFFINVGQKVSHGQLVREIQETASHWFCRQPSNCETGIPYAR